MPIIEWNVRFLLGIQELDRHHKQLVELLNQTYDDFRGGAKIEQAVVDQLVGYGATHFACEERWMTESSYPRLAEHMKEHEIYNSRILEFQKKSAQRENVSVEILWFLCNWVTHHMLETDVKFGEFMDIRNIRKKSRHKFD